MLRLLKAGLVLMVLAGSALPALHHLQSRAVQNWALVKTCISGCSSSLPRRGLQPPNTLNPLMLSRRNVQGAGC